MAMNFSRPVLPAALVGLLALAACGEKDAQMPAVRPALTVSAVAPKQVEWPQTLAAGGNVAAWQEGVIGAEISNFRITEVLVNVGDPVRKGQALARIASDTVDNELAEARAAVAEAQATLEEARANAERARQLREKGFFSPQQAVQSRTAADTAQARLNGAQARLESARLRRANANILAPDDGIISARAATVGSLTQPGQELFRLIRGNRLEWRAEVPAAALLRLQPGQKAHLQSPGGTATLAGTVRAVAPTVDTQTRNGLVYVDLPPEAFQTVSAGMFVQGTFELGASPALALPQSAVLLREGFAYVFRLAPEQGGLAKVIQVKVGTGRRQGEWVEITGLEAQSQVVASGGGFLADGDTVRLAASAP